MTSDASQHAPVSGRRRNGQFAPGTSGNPGGRPVRPDVLLLAREAAATKGMTLEAQVVQLLGVLYKRALKGDLQALREWFDRVVGRVPIAVRDKIEVDHKSGGRTFDEVLRSLVEQNEQAELEAAEPEPPPTLQPEPSEASAFPTESGAPAAKPRGKPRKKRWAK